VPRWGNVARQANGQDACGRLEGIAIQSRPIHDAQLFQTYFESQKRLGGVEVIADDSVGSLNYPAPIWPDKWTLSILSGPDHMKHTASEVAAVNSLVTSEEDPTEPTVVLNQWVDPAPPERRSVFCWMS